MRVTSKVTLDVKALRALKASLAEAGKAEIQVGIFAYDANRDDDKEMSNADIGAVHEFGSKSGHIPARSFLRMPCETKLPTELKRLPIMQNIVKHGAHETLREIGQVAEGEVDKAFATAGFGTWAPNSKRTRARKGSSSPLIDTGKLRRAVTSRVEKAGK